MTGLLVRGVRRVANTLNAFGFSQYSGNGSAPTYEQTKMAIKNGNTTPIFWGDPVIQASGTTGGGTGYITQALPVPQAVSITGGSLAAGVLTFTLSCDFHRPALLLGLTSPFSELGGTSTATRAPPTAPTRSSPLRPRPHRLFFPGAYTTGTASGLYLPPRLRGCSLDVHYLSTAIKHRVWSRYWPGTSDSAGDVTAYVITDPNAQFSVQTANSNTTSTAGLGFANVGQNISFLTI